MRLRIVALVLACFALTFCGQCPDPPHPPDPVYVTVQVCPVTHLRAVTACPPAIPMQFEAGHEPADCTHRMVTLCAETRQRANAWCPVTEDVALLPEEVPGVCTKHVKPPEPVIPTKVPRPWKPGGFLSIWSGLLYSDIAYAALDETKLDALCEAMAVDGGNNARRWFAWYADAGTAWAGTGLFPWKADWSWDPQYWDQLDRRVNMWAGKRDGTEIISILDACSMYEDSSWLANPLSKIAARPADVYWPGPARDKILELARELVRRLAKYGERIIYELRNEGEQLVGPDALYSYDTAMITALKAAGVPAERIQVEYYDAGLYFDELSLANYLGGDGLAATHRICSPEDLSWYETSPGKQILAALGDYPCSDGPGFAPGAPGGLFWFWLPGGQGRRPSAPQMASMTATARRLGLRGIEFLSASAFQRGNLPNLDDAITIGRAERLAMRQ